jgi:hypothetical protein
MEIIGSRSHYFYPVGNFRIGDVNNASIGVTSLYGGENITDGVGKDQFWSYLL